MYLRHKRHAVLTISYFSGWISLPVHVVVVGTFLLFQLLHDFHFCFVSVMRAKVSTDVWVDVRRIGENGFHPSPGLLYYIGGVMANLAYVFLLLFSVFFLLNIYKMMKFRYA